MAARYRDDWREGDAVVKAMNPRDGIDPGRLSVTVVRAAGDGGVDLLLPPSLSAYLATRTDDVAAAARSLAACLHPAGLWIPVDGSATAAAGLSACRFDAFLLIRRERSGLSAMITAVGWSVRLAGEDAWVDVEWPSHQLASAMDGQRLRDQIDFPFLSDGLIVHGSEPLGGFMRFHCGVDTGSR